MCIIQTFKSGVFTIKPFLKQFFIAFFSFVFFQNIVLAQTQNISFEASADAKQVVENEYFEVTFTLREAQGSSFRPPSFKGFNIISGPSTSNSMTILNGVRSITQGYTYTLQSKKVGNYTIGTASIQAANKTWRTQPLQVQVLKAKQVAKGADAKQELFVRIEVDTNDVYIGQQVILSYKLYTTVNIESYDVLQESGYAGFYAHDIRRFNAQVKREIIDGVQYTTKVLKKIALFPQQSGLLKIKPMSLRLGMIIGKSRRNSFFFNNKIRPVTVSTNELDISIKDLPSPQPNNFSGAVGDYSIAFNLARNKVTTDDAISIKLAIRGDGDIKRLQPPNLSLPPEFELYEPKVIEENSLEKNGRLSGYKQIEYLMIPKQSGQYEVRPSFAYFDPDSTKYITLQPNVFNITVAQGSGRATEGIVATTTEKVKDIRYIKTQTTLAKKSTPFIQSGLFYGLSILPFMALAGVVFYKRSQQKNGQIDIAILKSKRAQKVAKERLKVAHNFLEKKQSRPFYDEISKALLGYVGDKLRIPLSELSKDNVREKLQSLNVQSSYIEDVTSIIKTTEMALFAGMDNTASMQEIYDKSASVLSKIEEELIKA